MKNVKEPDTGIAKRFPRPREEWIPVTCPQIIDRPTWEAAQHLGTQRDRLRTRTGEWEKGDRGSRPGPRRHLLSGFLTCGTCGGSVYVHSRGRMACGKRREMGATVCPDSQRISQAEIEHRVLEALQRQVLVEEVVLAITEKATQRVRSAQDSGCNHERLRQLERRLGNLVENLA